jgi:putative transposase
MTSKPIALLLADLGVTKTYSRPYVSNDNPFSEAQFKTLKCRPTFPERLGYSIRDALVDRHEFFVQHRTSSFEPWAADARRRASRPRSAATLGPRGRARHRLRCAPERFAAGPPQPPRVLWESGSVRARSRCLPGGTAPSPVSAC